MRVHGTALQWISDFLLGILHHETTRNWEDILKTSFGCRKTSWQMAWVEDVLIQQIFCDVRCLKIGFFKMFSFAEFEEFKSMQDVWISW